MSVNYFIPTIWSENLLQALDQNYVGVANCVRDFEGEIKEKGSSVKIPGITGINIKNYTANSDMEDPQELLSFYRELVIDQAKYFHFQVDDIDRAQATPHLMDCAMRVAANNLAKEADKHVYKTAETAYHQMEFFDTSELNVLEPILQARQRLYEEGILGNTDVVLEISPAIATLLFKAKIELSTHNEELLTNGCIGSIAGCKVFVTNNLDTGITEDKPYYQCVMRSKRSMAFAEQLSEIVAYCPEKRFADAIKGLHLYGAKILYPHEVINLRLYLPEIIYEE